ncbi:MAG: response regulator [Deltaproteobacteria bacterium]|nr:MAG: response regulator [Deltaproteobacteria bacterium]
MLRIMLADDSRFFRSIERQFLQKTPAQVVEVASSDDLFSQLEVEKPQLLFLAWSMRPLTGEECCRRIKATPAFRDLPVILVCDQDMPGQVDSARRAGCDAVLSKPLHRQLFLQAGRQFLSGIREHRQSCFMAVNFEWQGETLRGKSLDISSGGIFVESPADVPVGEALTLSFVLPGTDRLISCRGEVVWLNRRPNPLKPHYPTGFGLRFSGLSPHLAEEFGRLARR